MIDAPFPSATPKLDTRLWPTVLGGWALAAIVLCLAYSGAIATLRFPDPDDAMRLLEVRDWLGGQSWWDVAQHRLNGGDFAMHWSRLVDLPIAAAMLVLDPFFSIDTANRIAMTIVPLMTLFALMALAAALTRQVSDVERAKLALLLAPLSVPILYQIRPLRIDHHGWQIVLAMAATMALLGRANLRNGILAGLALATLVTISLEGLPVAVTITAVGALAWAWDPSRRAALIGLAITFIVAALMLHIATRGPGAFTAVCDAVSPGWLAVLGVAAVGLSVATLFGARSLAARLGALAAGAGACVATLALITPECLRGPFASLDPLVYNLWYLKVSEGLPIWDQMLVPAIITIASPVVGLIGTALALRRTSGAGRESWAMLLAILLGAFAVSLMVQRAAGTANALALPGGAWILLAMLERARRIVPVLPRILATMLALIVVSPGIVAGTVYSVSRSNALPGGAVAQLTDRVACTKFSDVRGIAILPPSVIFAPLDLTPDLIATTKHRGIASGYHRNVAAMHRVIATFTGSPKAAEAMIIASGAQYVVGCPALDETEIYKHFAPNGLWARLERGERFAWLTPVPIAGSPVLAWRVNNSSRAPLSGAPVRP